jgi:hypothetical protein
MVSIWNRTSRRESKSEPACKQAIYIESERREGEREREGGERERETREGEREDIRLHG